MEIIYREAKEAAQQNDNAKLVQSYQAARKIEGWKSERGKFEALLERRIPILILTTLYKEYKYRRMTATFLPSRWHGILHSLSRLVRTVPSVYGPILRQKMKN